MNKIKNLTQALKRLFDLLVMCGIAIVATGCHPN